MTNKAGSLFFILKGLVLIIIGVVFIANPLNAARLIAEYIGILLIIGGLVAGYNVYRINHQAAFSTVSYLAPFISILCGAWLLFFSEYALLIFAFCVGFWVLIDGISHIKTARTASKIDLNFGRWLMFMGILSLLLALTIFYNPEGLVSFLTAFLGIVLLLSGVFLMIIGFRLRR